MGRSMVAWLTALAGAGVWAGCLERPLAFRCDRNNQCQSRAGAGVCEQTGYCSFPDAACPSGRRYGHYAALDKSDRCTECGNGSVDPGEECDDGNSATGDACLPTCRWNVCGDGFKRDGVEECDDGNTQDGDDCSRTCLRCADGDAHFLWTENAHCYTRWNAPRTWADAQQACSERGAHLITYNSALEQTTVRPALLMDAGGAAWIGLRDTGSTGMYQWVTSEPVIVPMPGFGPPFPTGQCVANNRASGAWAYASCASLNGSLCEDPGWAVDPTRHHAYRAFFAQPSWMLARQTCERWGGHLLTLRDSAEQEFISARFFGNFWLGATISRAGPGDAGASDAASSDAGTPDATTGDADTTETDAGTADGGTTDAAALTPTVTWITGEPLTFINFAAGEPDNDRQPSCLALGTDRRWHDRPCDGSLRGPYGFICEVE